MQNDQINTICAKYQVDTMLSFSNAPGGMLSHVEDVTKERPVGSMVRPLSKLPLFDELRLRTCWPWRRVGSVSRAAAECCAFLRRPDPQITHLLIHRGRGALLQSSSKLSPRGEAPLCNNEFGIQLTKAHLDLWYCRTAREGSYYGVLYNRVLVQHAKLHACARHSFVFLTHSNFFCKLFSCRHQQLCVCRFCTSSCFLRDISFHFLSRAIDQTSSSGLSFIFCLRGDVLTFKAAVRHINNLHSDCAVPLNIHQNTHETNVPDVWMLYL